jgi:4-hydroxybenzoate polyprenyltransferase
VATGLIKMKFLLETIKTFRIINFVIIAFLEIVLHQHIIVRELLENDIAPTLTLSHLIILIIFTIILTWSGYLINDITDHSIDQINKPGLNQVNALGGLKNAKRVYLILIGVTILISVFLSSVLQKWQYLWLVPILLFSLWLYSTKMKNHFILGNLGVGILTCMVILLIWLAENSKINQIRNLDSLNLIELIFAGYAIFAFLTTWGRELIKDAEDIVGDRANGLKTFPIVFGLKSTNLYFRIILTWILAFLMLFCANNFEHFSNFQIIFGTFFIFLPLIVVFALSFKAHIKSDYSKMSQLMKLVMFDGIIFLLTLN